LQCVSGVQITGAGTVSIVGNKCWAVAVSNASANVLIKDSYQVITPSVTAGTLNIDGSAIFAATPASNAVTSSAGSFITLANSFVLNSAGTSVERVSLAGFYSILNLVYNRTSSTFTGTSLNAIDYFQYINADNLLLANTGSVQFADADSSNYVAFKAPSVVGSNVTWTLPSADGGSGQFLSTNGTGTLSWASAAAAGVTSFQTSLSGLTPSTSSTGAITLAGTLGATSGGTSQSTYTTGDLLYSSASNTLSKLGIGSTGQVLTVSAGGVPTWSAAAGAGVTTISFGSTGLTPSTATGGAVSVAGTLVAANGGTGQSSYTIGDLLYATGSTALSKLAIGANGYVLSSTGSALAWTAPGSPNLDGGVPSSTYGGTTAINGGTP